VLVVRDAVDFQINVIIVVPRRLGFLLGVVAVENGCTVPCSVDLAFRRVTWHGRFLAVGALGELPLVRSGEECRMDAGRLTPWFGGADKSLALQELRLRETTGLAKLAGRDVELLRHFRIGDVALHQHSRSSDDAAKHTIVATGALTHLLTQPAMSTSVVDVKVTGPVGTIVLNRPGRRNALSHAMLEQLAQALGDLHLEKRVRAIVLTGAGSAFCAGMDLNEMHVAAKLPDHEKQQDFGDSAEQYREVVTQMIELPKPIIASVNGPAVAGGAGLVLASDIVVATPAAQFGLPEPRRGIAAGVVAPLLAFRAGGGTAARLLLSSSLIAAQEAHRLGLYHELIDEPRLWARCVQLGEECAAGAPEALQLTKRLLYETIGEQLSTQLSVGAAMSATSRTTEAAQEGLAAFIEKRKPEWK
jgi:enoyl-CoA hydratase/carnithine racemase